MVKILFLLNDNEATSSLKKEEGINTQINKNNGPVYVLDMEKDGYPLATGLLIKLDPETYEISSLLVNKRIRHQQVGTYAVKSMLIKIKTLGGRAAIVNSPLDLLPFFKKLGFREIDGEVIDNKVKLRKEFKFNKANYYKNQAFLY